MSVRILEISRLEIYTRAEKLFENILSLIEIIGESSFKHRMYQYMVMIFFSNGIYQRNSHQIRNCYKNLSLNNKQQFCCMKMATYVVTILIQ